MPELIEWAVFEEDFGPLTLHERIDGAAAMIAYALHVSAGGKGDLKDFIPRWEREGKAHITDWLSAMAR